MDKTLVLRSLYRSLCSRSYHVAAVSHSFLRHQHQTSRSLFNLSSPSLSGSPNRPLSGCLSSLSMGIGSKRFYSEDVSHMPVVKDPKLYNAFKDLMANSWDELPSHVIHDVKAALSKSTDDTTGKEVVANVFRAAEAVEEFGDILVNLKMEIDDSIGMSGEDVKPLSDELKNALHTVHKRYTTYLDAFGPDETYLRKKVETELGTKMIHLKMRCSGLDSDWGKVTVLGTSGLSGSYVEQRA
ncbi:succinate dehydrogenase subunit 5, mitochondrial [Juglans microcarpa x Juglans regia]|uniref:succinate dehydrogenase subunit 5, mitochondrial n=1 Tax=Juglans microcarpa x Juglans regia TaxID=2249226 RepID=UPI001B7DD069|nr:succinate dehydrogenase subunit 5, mitochondrial [Juglans microcarpa x Juglans regia]